ncbi:MAG: hypothetical protein KIT80_10570 [Chitinophagaceae bacterium]|nr:hypothetical protein [Chitinophagaceae bacterium]MCW5927345.1 hypothetical protein [Chitinophagaceae bacterium]
MKKEDIPQDKGYVNELSYAVDKDGKYTTEKSIGWEVKIKALDVAWGDIEKKVEAARQKVINNEASPVLYFMELKIMDIPIIAGYTGFWQWQVKRHLKPRVFEKLSSRKLEKYASVFEITIEELKNLRHTLLQNT